MRKIWMILRKRDVRRVIFFILIGLIWAMISWGLAVTSSVNAANLTLKPVLQTKLLLLAALFGGRYLFFPAQRWPLFFKWTAFLLFLLIGGAGWVQPGEWPLNSSRLMMQIGDFVIWAVVLGACAELFAALFHQRSDWNEIDPGTLRGVWENLSRNLIKMGTMMAMVLGILYYYLINLFLVDIFCYSYLLLIPLLGCGGIFFGIRYGRVCRRLDQAIQEIDLQMTEVLQADSTNCRDVLPHFQFLVLSRNYLEKLKKPSMVCGVLVVYFFWTAFVLGLPYLLGFAIEV